MMQTPQGDRQLVLGGHGLMAPAADQSRGMKNPTIPSEAEMYLRGYSGGIGSLPESVVSALVASAKHYEGQWGQVRHGDDGLPDTGANLPGPEYRPVDLSDQPAVLGGWGNSIGGRGGY